MNMIKSTLKLTLILYLCVALSGVYILSAAARITPKEGGEDTTLITIVKGDTLWDLCQEHLKDPLRWRELSKYNDFTNPDLIYPGEKLRIPVSMVKAMEEDIDDQNKDLQIKLQAANEEANALGDKLADSEKRLAELKKELEKATKEVEALQKELKAQDKLIKDAVNKSVDNVNAVVKKELAAAQEAILKKITQTNRRINAVEKLIAEHHTAMEAIGKQLTSVNQNVESMLKQIEMNQQALKEIKMAIDEAEGVHENLSSSKRAIVFITTVAAGIGWFVINTIGGRSGE